MDTMLLPLGNGHFIHGNMSSCWNKKAALASAMYQMDTGHFMWSRLAKAMGACVIYIHVCEAAKKRGEYNASPMKDVKKKVMASRMWGDHTYVMSFQGAASDNFCI